MAKETYTNRNYFGFFDPTASKAVWHVDRALGKQKKRTRAGQPVATAPIDPTLTYSFDGRPSCANSPSKRDLRSNITKAQRELENLRSLLHEGIITQTEFEQQRPVLAEKYNQARNATFPQSRSGR